MQDLNKLAGIGTSTLAIPSETTRLYGFRRQLYAYRQSRIEHKSYREIAAVLGVCAARVGQLVKRAEQQMSRMEAPPGGYTQQPAKPNLPAPKRLKALGVTRSTVLVHHECKPSLESLRPHFVDPVKAEALAALVVRLQDIKTPTNVAQVRQLSPFRYPGGKTWLVPEVRKWLISSKQAASVFVEPFAGGAMAGLTAAAEGLAEQVFLCELDEDVSAVWKTIFQGSDADVRWLYRRITDFEVNHKNVRDVLAGDSRTNKEKAFRTIVKNRMQRGGIMAAGAGLVKTGEAGRGLHSRWYPETLAARITVLRSLRARVTFKEGDAFECVQQFSDDSNAFFFVDPPYTAGGKNAGKRLYTHNEIDHERLFALMASVRGSVMMTYGDAREVRDMAERHGFRVEAVPMKNTHHEIIRELLILKP